MANDQWCAGLLWVADPSFLLQPPTASGNSCQGSMFIALSFSLIFLKVGCQQQDTQFPWVKQRKNVRVHRMYRYMGERNGNRKRVPIAELWRELSLRYNRVLTACLLATKSRHPPGHVKASCVFFLVPPVPAVRGLCLPWTHGQVRVQAPFAVSPSFRLCAFTTSSVYTPWDLPVKSL